MKSNKNEILNKENNKKNSKNKDKNSKDKSKTLSKESKEEEKQIASRQNPKNIERFIYITKYSDINSLKIINQLFEDINTLSFNLKSKGELISKILSEEEQNNNEIDYISGFQIVDKKIRLTIIEGITGKGIQKVKNALPKTKMNDENFKIFSNFSILFDKRIYSKFNLSLKFFKLRKNLQDILTSFEIYAKANKYRNIYDTFMNLSTILRSDTLEDISNSNSFPDVDKLVELERKFGDVLSHEDLTGEKKVKKYNIRNLLLNFEDINSNNKSYATPSLQTQKGKSNLIKSMKLIPINKKVRFVSYENNKGEPGQLENNENNINTPIRINKSTNNRYLTIDIDNRKSNNIDNLKNNDNIYKSIELDNIIDNNYNSPIHNKLNNLRYNSIDSEKNNYNSKRYNLFLNQTPKVEAKNIRFIRILKNRENKIRNPIEIFNRNKEYLNIMLKKKSPGRFCRPFDGEYDKKKQILFSPSRINHYEELVNEMRKKYQKNKNHYYSYSEKLLTLSFPMVEPFRNEEYLKYVENKSKWIVNKDFDRYKQPEREKIYFPRINKEI